LKKQLFTLLWLACLALSAAKYPPGQRWREIGRGGITIIFPAARFLEAEAALAAAEGFQGKMADFWRAQLSGRTRIVLDDTTDQANGFATFFPFNLVGVNLAEPPPDADIASGRDWLDLVLAHEMTHLFTFSAATDLGRALRRVFGTLPLLYSAAQMPPWAIEGLAVYGESRFSGDGRLVHAPYRLMLDAARRDGRFPGWNRIDGLPASWPGPTAKYLFGAGFMEFLAERYGADRLRQYLDRVAARLLLISSSRDFKNTFGEPLGKLWREYRDQPPAAGGAPPYKPAPEPLADNGFFNQYPCPLGDGRLAYYHRDYRGRGVVEMLDLQSRRVEALFRMDAVNCLHFAAKENKIFLSAADYFHSFNDFSDLYEFDLTARRLKRLSRGQRLSQPVKIENSEEIYCVQRRDGRYHLSLFDIGKRTVKTLSRGFAGLSQLSLSPDQSLLAAAVKPEGGPWGIGVFASSGELRTFICALGENCSQPRWIDNRTFNYIQAGASTTRLADYSMATGSGGFLDDPRLNGLQQFALSADGRTVYFTFYNGRGMEIARTGPLDPDLFTGQKVSAWTEVPEKKPGASNIPPRPYRFWRDLLPRWWTPALRSGGDELQAGIMTGGQDALGIHGYSLEGYYGFSSRRANILFRYVYDGLFPSLSLSYSDKSEYYRNRYDHYRIQELKLASLWPLRVRKRSQLYAYADLHLERLSEIGVRGTYVMPSSYNGFRLGLDFNSAREYYDSVSPSDGVRFTLQGSVHPGGIGNDWASRSMQADLRHFIPLFRPGVLAWRLALARRWDAGNHIYVMGGRETGSGLGDDQPFKLQRGVSAGSQIGDRGWLFNLECRMPLFKVEKAVVPSFSLDRVWLTTFFDMGRLSTSYFSFPVAYSVGGEAVLRLAFGGAAATDLALGVAHGFGDAVDLWVYLRLGRSF
jgi:hypothetical protein